MTTARRRALEWIVSDDTGLSSQTLWATMMGVKHPGRNYPLDPDDIGRCFRLLELVPHWKARIKEMRRIHPCWRALVRHWDELRSLMDEEVGIDWSKGRKAGRTYGRMKEILEPVEQREFCKTR